MLNAKDARVKASDVNQGRAKTELDQIEKVIDKAVSNGEFSCHVGCVLATVQEHLKSLGYKLNSYNDRNETCTTISW
jgi:tetrahydromethanopterin S-methyltransferase subunit A